MELIDLSYLSDQELLQKVKKVKTSRIIDASIIGFCIGIIVYSSVKNGLDFFTLFPLILVYVIAKNATNYKALENELKSRKLTK